MAGQHYKPVTVPIPYGATLIIAAAACLVGTVIPNLYAAIVAAILLVLALIAFAMRRAGRVLETILDEELPRVREPRPEAPLHREPQPHV